MDSVRVAIGTDHRGVGLKNQLAAWLAERGHQVADLGAHSEESVDYPDIAHLVSRQVAGHEADRGVLICGTGIGMAIAANKTAGIRAHSIRSEYEAEISRRHNDLNVLCLCADLPLDEQKKLIQLFLETPFDGGRHARRVAKLEKGQDCAE